MLNKLFNSYFFDFDKQLTDICKENQKQISDTIKKFKENTIDQVDGVVAKKVLRNIKNILEEELIVNLEDSTKVIISNTCDSIKTITEKTKEVILFNLNSPYYNISSCSSVISEYKEKVSDINVINKNFIKKFDGYFDLLTYYISADYELKNDIPGYKLICKVIKQNKKILMDSFKGFIENYKNNVISLFSNYINSFIEEGTDLKDNINNKNHILLVDYSKDLLQNNCILSINQVLKDNCSRIKDILDDCHKDILKLQKSKKTNEKEIPLSILNNDLISFNNTLFDKALTTLLKMVSTVECEKKEAEKNIARYNQAMYKICEYEYNFDRQFLKYKNEMLAKKYFISSKIDDEITKRVNESKEQIVEIIKLSVISVFKENVTYLNSITYKTMMVEYRIQDGYELMSEKTINKLFA